MKRLYLMCLASCVMGTPALAQDPAPAVPAQAALPDPATIPMPKLDFTPTAEDQADYIKYFYFHRDGTSFAEAYADLKECDALSSGISYYAGGSAYSYGQYGMAGALGGAIGSAIADAVFGSAERRKMRRLNMRNCMGFKGYQRFGLNRELWVAFNFEEGNGRKPDEEREQALRLQARVASGAKPPQQMALKL